jgi:hypothetical protein
VRTTPRPAPPRPAQLLTGGLHARAAFATDSDGFTPAEWLVGAPGGERPGLLEALEAAERASSSGDSPHAHQRPSTLDALELATTLGPVEVFKPERRGMCDRCPTCPPPPPLPLTQGWPPPPPPPPLKCHW